MRQSSRVDPPKVSVLIVDDACRWRQAERELLERRGYADP
jgi:PleD family two-component response regulator